MNEQDLKAEFGDEAVIHRLWLSHLNCHGTVVSATIEPHLNEAETLQKSWCLVQALARWLFTRTATVPTNERFEIIVGWSRCVRAQQGQIFKLGGATSDLQRILEFSTYASFAESGVTPLRSNWQKNVFGKEG